MCKIIITDITNKNMLTCLMLIIITEKYSENTI